MKIAPRQYRNQRLGRPPQQRRQQHLLEVSIRRDKERVRRLKAIALVVGKVFLFSILAVGAWIGTGKALQRYLWQNPVFYLTDVRVNSDGTLTREQILTTAGVVEGANIFTLDLPKIRTTLSGLAQVSHVEVQRTFPHRLDIEVTERQPTAWLTEQADIDPTATDRAYLIDVHGFVMKKSPKLLPEYAHLPIISGTVLENLAIGQKAKDLEILAALELLKLTADSTRWQVRNIDISRGYCLVAKGRDHAPILFSPDNLDRQWARLNHIFDYAASIHKEVQTANLLIERNTPVVFYDPDAEPAVVAAPPAGVLPPPAAGKPGAVPPKPGAAGAAKAGPTPKPEPAKASGAGKTENRGKSTAPKSTNFKGPADVRKPFRNHG